MPNRDSPHVRPAALSGTWYPSARDELRSEIESLLALADAESSYASHRQPQAIMVPHAGLIYSGRTAAHAFQAVKQRPNRVILIGPAHRIGFEGISAGLFSHYQCPLSDFPVDLDTLDILLTRGLVRSHPEAHLQEHCLEIMLPFMGVRWPGTLILPFLVSRTYPSRVKDLLDHVVSPGDLVCLSSDLSHFLTYEEARTRDSRTLETIHSGRWEDLGPQDACGCTAIAGWMQHTRDRPYVISTLDYRNSGDTAGSKDRVVGYGALGFQRTDSE